MGEVVQQELRETAAREVRPEEVEVNPALLHKPEGGVFARLLPPQRGFINVRI
jgi:hypothetical protein